MIASTTFKPSTSAVLLLALISTPIYAGSPALNQLLSDYQGDSTLPFSAERGASLWHQKQDGRSCTSCHTDDPHNVGRHQKTGKPIDSLAPSVNHKRLTDPREMKKWLLRNCKWTLKRECSAQEKGDFLTWLSTQ